MNFSKRLLELAGDYPDREIIHFLKTGESDQHLTYRALIEGAGRYQAALRSRNVLQGEVVILILQQSIELVYAYFGTILNGSIPSIMPFLTEKLLPEKYRKDLVSLIEITQPSAILTYRDFTDELSEIQADNAFIKALLFSEEIETGAAVLAGTGNYPGTERDGNDIVLLQHSSGSTGLQKGVALTHQAVFHQLDCYSKTIRLSSRDVIVSWLPLYHDMGLIACFLMPILYNVPLEIMSPFDWVRAPHRLFQAISHYRGTLCWLPNFAYNFCAQKIRPADMEGIELSTLRAVINCSEPMRRSSHQAFLERFSQYGLQPSAIATSYAMAENVFAVTQDGIDKAVTYDEIDQETFQKDKIARKVFNSRPSIYQVSAGKPIANTQVRIIDGDGRELPDRHVGEIAIKSNCMLTGYYHREDETVNSFSEGWFKTGDLGYLAEGELYVSGRKKDLIIVGGKNVYPQDIEAVVNEVEGVHPGRCVAFGVFNEEKGTEDVVVIAELERDFAEKDRQVADQIRKMVTQSTAVALRQVYLVNDFWLIKTSSGKIARAANKEKYLFETGHHAG